MSSYLTVKWGDAIPGVMRKPAASTMPADRIQMAVDDFPCVQTAVAKRMPSVLFVFSELKQKRGGNARPASSADKAGSEELSEAAKRSLAVYERVFDNVQDVPLRVLLRFCQCTRMDVTKVPAGTHPDIAEANAPLVLIVDAQGKVAQLLSQTRIDSRSLSLGVADVLKKGGLRDVETLCTSTVKLMDEMENALVAKGKLDIKMNELRTALADCEAKDRRRPNKTGQPLPPSSSTLRARQAIAALQPSLDAADKLYADLKERDAAMLRNAGVDITAWQKTVMPTAESAAAASTAAPARTWSGAPAAATPAAAAAGGAPTLRVWTSISGKTLEGRFAQLQQDTVVLAKADGTIVQIPLSKLSPSDQVVARQAAASRGP